MITIEPSLLAANPLRLRYYILACAEAGAESLEIDVMDGIFVQNFGFSPSVVRIIHSISTLELHVHLIVTNPERYIQSFIEAGATRIAIHQESCFNLKEVIAHIHQMNAQACVVLNPDTPLSSIERVLGFVDMVQLMTVYPGCSGQEYLVAKGPKILRLKQMLLECDLDTPIAVDGGITVETAPLAVLAGATVLISGNAVFECDGTVGQNYDALLHSVLKAQS